MLTTKEAAEYLGVSMARIRQLINEGRLSAQRNGKSWLVRKESLDDYRAQAAVGRPTREEARRRSKTNPVRYTLMSGNYEVARCVYDPLEVEFTQVDVLDPARVPLAFHSYQMQGSYVKAFNEWWCGRGIPGSRHMLKERLCELKLRSAAELPLRSYGLSLSDQYWLATEGSSVAWADVNFFRNNYDMGEVDKSGEASSRAGAWMNAVGLSSPDNTTDGMLSKRWILSEEGRRVLIKGCGSSGREAYNEVIATKLYQRLLAPGRYVEYRLGKWRNEAVSVCETFLGENEEFIPAWYVFQTKKKPNNHSAYRHYCELCEDMRIPYIQNQMTRMLVCDSILANTDRHWGNFGIVRNVNTLECKWAPIFDTGTSLWTHKLPYELSYGAYNFQSKPFHKDPKRQLEMLCDASWYHPEALEGFSEEVLDFLAKALASEELATAISKGISKRIDEVNAWARQAPTFRMHESLLENPEKIQFVWL